MWVTTDNLFISDNQPDVDGYLQVRRPCPKCLGSGINCSLCVGSGELPAILERVIPVYEWAAMHGFKMPFNKSVEQHHISQLLDGRISTKSKGKHGFHTSLLQSLHKSNFPTRLQYRYILPFSDDLNFVNNHTISPLKADTGVLLNLSLTVKNIDVLTRRCSQEKFSSLLLETNERQHLVAYDGFPSRFNPDDIIHCDVLTIKRLWINNRSLILVKLVSVSVSD